MAKVPQFNSEQEASEFWDTHDFTDYVDDTVPADVNFIDARPRKTLISLRLDPTAIQKLKLIAGSKGIGYQTLIRIWMMERLAQEEASPPHTSTPTSERQ